MTRTLRTEGVSLDGRYIDADQMAHTLELLRAKLRPEPDVELGVQVEEPASLTIAMCQVWE